MHLSLKVPELKAFIAAQLANFFPDRYVFEGGDVDAALDQALQRTEWCFRHISHSAYSGGGEAHFSHLHSDQYSQFLYYLANSLLVRSQNRPLCDKLILLNKALNGLFFTYNAGLPDIFLFGHPIGSILGNASYADFLVVFQNVTVNTHPDAQGNRGPVLGKGLYLAAGAKVIGDKPIGDRVSIGVDTTVYFREVPSDTLVYTGADGSLAIVPKKGAANAQAYFNVPIL